MKSIFYHFLLFAFGVFIPAWGLGGSITAFFFMLYWILEGEWAAKWSNIRSATFFWFLGLIPVLYFITFFISPTENFFEVQKRIVLFFIPLFILSSSRLNKESFYYLLAGFVIGTLFIDLKALLFIALEYWDTSQLDFGQGSRINEIIRHERPYLSFYSALSYSFLLYGLLINAFRGFWKYFLIFSALLFCFIPFLLAAKLAILLIVLNSIVIVLYSVSTNSSIRKTGFIIIGTLPIFVLISFYTIPGIQTRFNDLIEKGDEPRIFIWKTAVRLASSDEFNPFYGFLGEKAAEEQILRAYKQETQRGLSSIYREEAMEIMTNNGLISEFELEVPVNKKDRVTGKWFWIYASKFNFNTHNQFLGLYLSFGVIGLSCLFFALGSVLRLAFFHRNILLIITLFSLGCFLLFENVLARQQGVFLVAGVFSVFFGLSRKKT